MAEKELKQKKRVNQQKQEQLKRFKNFSA